MRKRERGKKRDRGKEREGETVRGREWEREKRFLYFNIPSTTLGHLRKRESKCLCALWIYPLSLQLFVLRLAWICEWGLVLGTTAIQAQMLICPNLTCVAFSPFFKTGWVASLILKWVRVVPPFSSITRGNSLHLGRLPFLLPPSLSLWRFVTLGRGELWGGGLERGGGTTADRKGCVVGVVFDWCYRSLFSCRNTCGVKELR